MDLSDVLKLKDFKELKCDYHPMEENDSPFLDQVSRTTVKIRPKEKPEYPPAGDSVVPPQPVETTEKPTSLTAPTGPTSSDPPAPKSKEKKKCAAKTTKAPETEDQKIGKSPRLEIFKPNTSAIDALSNHLEGEILKTPASSDLEVSFIPQHSPPSFSHFNQEILISQVISVIPLLRIPVLKLDHPINYSTWRNLHKPQVIP
jgi:hypothetical protein